MRTGYSQKQLKTRQVILDSECDGLRVLARIIARVHMKRMPNKRTNKDGHLHNGKPVIIVQKRPINTRGDRELVDEESDGI